MDALSENGELPATLRYAGPDGRYSISIDHYQGPIFDVREKGYADDVAGRGLTALFTRLLDSVEQDGRFPRAHLCVDYSEYRGSSGVTRWRMLREVVTRPAMGCTAFYGTPWWARTVAALLTTVVPRVKARHFDDRDAALAYLQDIVQEEGSVEHVTPPEPEPPPPVADLEEPPGPEQAHALLQHHRAEQRARRAERPIPSDVAGLQALVREQREQLNKQESLLDRLFDTIAQISSLDTYSPEWVESPDAPDSDEFWAVEGAMHLMRSDLAQMFAKRDRQSEELAAARAVAEDANRAKSHFLAVVSHELRTPLNAIVGLSTLLGDDIGDDPIQLRRVEGIACASRRLGHLVEDLLDYTRLEAGALQLAVRPFDLTALLRDIDEAWRPRSQDRPVRLEIVRPEAPLWVEGDPDRLGQVLGNQIDNALKFTDEGVVQLSMRRTAEGATQIEVRDTGRGIPASDIDRVFGRFEQSDLQAGEVVRGVGLGLTICKHLVELMGGELRVDSEVGRGTAFELRLALPDADDPPGTDRFPSLVHPTWPGGRVLVVEDDPLSRFVARGMLERYGCQVTLAEDGQQGLEAWGREEFDLIFMDIQLPELDGYGATRAIRASGESGRPRTPIVAMTAYALDSDRSRAEAAGMDGFLVKPVAPDQLERALSRFLPRSLRVTQDTEAVTASESGRTPALRPELDPQTLSALFEETTPALLDRLRGARERDDSGEAARIAHQLKGQAATLGAEPLRSACEQLEQLDGWSNGSDGVLETIALEVARLGEALRRAAADAVTRRSTPGDRIRPRGRLMLVDDDPVVRTLTGTALERSGFAVEAIGHPFEALERFRDAGGSYDAVILDLHLPEMDGLEVLDAMRGIDPRVRAVLCSGEAIDPDSLPAGAEYLAKPLRAGDLAAVIERLAAE